MSEDIVLDQEEIKNIKEELALVKDVLGNLIAWLPHELGATAQKELMDRLYPNGIDKS